MSNTLIYNGSEWDQNIKAKRNQYWAMLQRAKHDFMKLTDQSSLEYEAGDGAFYYYLQRNYGLRMELIDGKITSHYDIVDEAKYLMFVMKYGS